MLNSSGGTIIDQGTVAGSSLSSVRNDLSGTFTGVATVTGTWKNVTGASVFDALVGDFVGIA